MPWWTLDDYGWQLEERWAAEDAQWREQHEPPCPYCHAYDDEDHGEDCPLHAPPAVDEDR
jgi:hypothetical protein